MKKTDAALIGATLLGLIGVAVWYMRQSPPPLPQEPQAPAIQAVSPAVAPASSPALAASAPAIAHPIEAPASDVSGPASLDIKAMLTDVFGQKSVLAMFQLQDFPRRVAATVDNLGRSQAPASLWPVNPTSGRFTVQKLDGATVIGPDNGLRYTPFLLLVESADMRVVASTYARLYPLFQQAYEEIGFPGRYFNDRLVEVIDQMLATPEIEAPLKVSMPTLGGPVHLTRPWVLYRFDDPALQSLNAGQKILLRMGPVNARRMKTKLAEFRRLVTSGQTR